MSVLPGWSQHKKVVFPLPGLPLHLWPACWEKAVRQSDNKDMGILKPFRLMNGGQANTAFSLLNTRSPDSELKRTSWESISAKTFVLGCKINQAFKIFFPPVANFHRWPEGKFDTIRQSLLQPPSEGVSGAATSCILDRVSDIDSQSSLASVGTLLSTFSSPSILADRGAFSCALVWAILRSLMAVFSPTLGSRQAKRKNAVLSLGWRQT